MPLYPLSVFAVVFEFIHIANEECKSDSQLFHKSKANVNRVFHFPLHNKRSVLITHSDG